VLADASGPTSTPLAAKDGVAATRLPTHQPNSGWLRERHICYMFDEDNRGNSFNIPAPAGTLDAVLEYVRKCANNNSFFGKVILHIKGAQGITYVQTERGFKPEQFLFDAQGVRRG
jgi:hypothetical protein